MFFTPPSTNRSSLFAGFFRKSGAIETCPERDAAKHPGGALDHHISLARGGGATTGQRVNRADDAAVGIQKRHADVRAKPHSVDAGTALQPQRFVVVQIGRGEKAHQARPGRRRHVAARYQHAAVRFQELGRRRQSVDAEAPHASMLAAECAR
jgi:hypothetical protein